MQWPSQAVAEDSLQLQVFRVAWYLKLQKKKPNKQTNKNIKPFLKKKFNIEVMHMNAI